jgi:5-formyltetrahydrofolate cyclo-ligase
MARASLGYDTVSTAGPGGGTENPTPPARCDHRPMTKDELRRELAARRRALRPDEVAAASRAVEARVRDAVDWAATGSAHVYRSVPAWGELDTAGLLAWLAGAHPHVEVTIPSLHRDQPIPERAFDVILVPLLGFDRENNRLGLGGGFYDRFLARQPQAETLGLAYGWALVPDGLPVEPHDVPLHRIVTETEVRERG